MDERRLGPKAQTEPPEMPDRVPIARLSLFGRFALTTIADPSHPIRISSRKGRALLAYVAMQPGRSAAREELAGLLWGEHSEKNARQALRQCLATLREDLAPCAGCLVLDGDAIGVSPELLEVDALEFIELSKSAHVPDLEHAVTLYRGDFLADLKVNAEPFEDWLRVERSRLWGTAARLLEGHAERMSARDAAQPALEAAERLLAHDPLREDWHRLLLRLYARYRGRDAALVQAQAFATLLKRELDVAPEPATTTLVEQIRRGAFATPRAEVEADGNSDATPANDGAAPRRIESEERTAAAAAPSIGAGRSTSRIVHGGLALVALLGIFALVVTMFAMWRSGQLPESAAKRDHDASSELQARSRPAEQMPPVPPVSDVLGATDRSIIPIFIVPLRTSGEAADRRLADAITEDLIFRLERFSGLRVTSRDTAYLYEGKLVDPAVLRTIFGVNYAMEGRVSTQEAVTRVTVELIDTRTRLTVWADRWEANSPQLNDISDVIVKRLTRKLQVQTTYAESLQPPPPTQPSVKTLLAKALSAQYGGQNAESVQQALTYYEEALRREPNLVLAMTGVAAQLITAHNNYLVMPTPDLDRADKLLRRALELDPDAERVHYWLGHLHYARGEYDQALASFRRAFELNPSFAPALANVGRALIRLRRPQDALAEIERAMRLEPNGPVTRFGARFVGEARLEIGDYPAAIEWLERAATLDPHNPLGHALLAASYGLAGNGTKASEEGGRFKDLANPLLLAELMGDIKKEGASREAHRLRFFEGLQLVLSVRP